MEGVEGIISSKHVAKSSKKRKQSDDDVTELEDLKEELYRIKETIANLVKD